MLQEDFELEFVPEDRFITKDELFSLTDNEIYQLQTYCYLTFPPDVSSHKYENLRTLTNMVNYILNLISSDSILLCPGDSPSKIILLLQLLYDDYLEKNNIKIITFPLSGHSNYNNTKRYISKILNDNNITTGDNLIIIDHFNTGSSYNIIMNILLKQFNIIVPLINLSDIWKKSNGFKIYTPIEIKFMSEYGADVDEEIHPADNIYNELIINSEDTHSRCIPKYKLYQKMTNINVKRCNAIVTLMALLILNKLNVDIIFPNLLNFKLNKNEPYRVTYYDPSGIKSKREILLFENKKELLLEFINLNGQYVPIVENLIINVENIDHNIHITEEELHNFENQYVKITLLNNRNLIGYYTWDYFYYGLKGMKLQYQLIKQIVKLDISPSKIDVKPYINKNVKITFLNKNGKLVTKTKNLFLYFDIDNLILFKDKTEIIYELIFNIELA